MPLLNSKTADQAHDLLDYQVVDQTGDEVGSIHALWADPQTGALQFLGVKTGWLFGQNHVIPIERVEIDDATRTARIPYTAEFVKGALSIDADSEISDEQEAEIYRYYQTQGHATATATDVAASSGLAGTAETRRTSSTVTDKDTIEVPLTEEQLRVGKRTVDAGQVRLRKIVRTEIVNQPVEVRREDVVIERISAGEVREGTATSNFEEQVIDVPLTREEVVVQKDAHVTGAVRVHKTSTGEQQNVSETIRKEDVEVLRDGKTVTEESDLRK